MGDKRDPGSPAPAEILECEQMACDYAHLGWRCRGGFLHEGEKQASISHFCPKCNSRKFLIAAKSAAERSTGARLLAGCPCCRPGGSPLEDWLNAVELVHQTNANELPNILEKIAEVRVRNASYQVVTLKYD
jgi:hypothetical protein